MQVLLPEVRALMGEVLARRLSGSAVMRLLAAKSLSGMPAVQSCAQRLLWHCYQVMFKQLESWLVHGLLLDTEGEFFIQRLADSAGGGGAPVAGRASPSPLVLRPAGGGSSGTARGPQEWDPLEWHAGFQVGNAVAVRQQQGACRGGGCVQAALPAWLANNSPMSLGQRNSAGLPISFPVALPIR